jgi:hypothetical protein
MAGARAGFTLSVSLRVGRLRCGIHRWQSRDIAKNHRVLAGGNTGLDVGGMLGGTVCCLAGQKRLASGLRFRQSCGTTFGGGGSPSVHASLSGFATSCRQILRLTPIRTGRRGFRHRPCRSTPSGRGRHEQARNCNYSRGFAAHAASRPKETRGCRADRQQGIARRRGAIRHLCLSGRAHACRSASSVCLRPSLARPGSGSSGRSHTDRGRQTRPKGPDLFLLLSANSSSCGKASFLLKTARFRPCGKSLADIPHDYLEISPQKSAYRQ